MQEGLVLKGAPVTAIEAIAADEVQGARNGAAGASRKDEQAAIGLGLAEQLK
jgi:hypothetical protein